jgi:hypothetical protein
MIKGGKGGGNTATGLIYEGQVDLATFLATQEGYEVVKDSKGKVADVFYKGQNVAKIFKKHGFYTYLAEEGINWRDYLSSQLLPDDCIYVIINNTMFIIEVKHQRVNGSTDEKLATCDFKRKQYRKLLSRLNIEVEFVYILCDWFKANKYKDVLDYIVSVNCQYYFNYIPLQKLGLPVPQV